MFTGSDGKRYSNPCTSSDDVPKKSWPSLNAAYFVAERALEKHGRFAYAYACPKCSRYHLATCRTFEHRFHHDVGIQIMRHKLASSASSLTQKYPNSDIRLV